MTSLPRPKDSSGKSLLYPITNRVTMNKPIVPGLGETETPEPRGLTEEEIGPPMVEVPRNL